MTSTRTATFARSDALALSLAMIEALGRAGLMIVSAQPTPAMLMAGARAGGIAPADACRVFSAMLANED